MSVKIKSTYEKVVRVGPTAGENYWQEILSFYLIRVFTEILFNKNKGFIKSMIFVCVYEASVLWDLLHSTQWLI